jgi:hypothetical protein
MKYEEKQQIPIIFKHIPANYNACVEFGISWHLIDLPSHSILLLARRCFQEQQPETKEATIVNFPLALRDPEIQRQQQVYN